MAHLRCTGAGARTLAAVLLFIGAFTRARTHTPPRRAYVGVTAASLFWCLVTGIWLVLWVTYYLV